MQENPIIAEIHQHREDISRKCDFDPAKLIAYYPRKEAQRGDEGHPLVTLSPVEGESSVVREQPPADAGNPGEHA